LCYSYYTVSVGNQKKRPPVGLQIYQPETGYRFSIDSYLIANFANPPSGSTVIDLGCGVGVLGLLMCRKRDDLRFVGIECQGELVKYARRNIDVNSLRGRFDVIEGDIKEIGDYLDSGSCRYVISNPPYIEQGRGKLPPDEGKATAKSEVRTSLDDFIKASDYLLVNKGRLAMIYDARRLSVLMLNLKVRGLEPKRIRFVHPFIDRDANLVMVEAVKGGGVELKVERPLIVWDKKNVYSEELKSYF